MTGLTSPGSIKRLQSEVTNIVAANPSNCRANVSSSDGPIRHADGTITYVVEATGAYTKGLRSPMEAEHIPDEGAGERLQSPEPSEGEQWLQEMVVASGISLRLWRLYAQAWLVCLLFPILALMRLHLELLHLALALMGLLIFVTGYTWVMWSHPLRSVARLSLHLRQSLLLLAGLTALVLWLSVAYDSSFLWLFVGVSAIAGVTLPARSAFVAVIVLTLLTLFVSVGISGGIATSDWLHILPLVLLVRGLGLDMVGIVRLSSALREVHAARAELARVAVIEERLRLARDLHDLLGHTLSLIILKSELAGRVVETEPRRAAQEIREIEQVARQSLREVREAVAGYRQPRLGSELDGARQLLEAAGIACQIEYTSGELPAATDAVLAWTVREGVTNVIRHSRAHHCTIRVTCDAGSVRAEVINDGDGSRYQANTVREAASGLLGLTERVRAYGGDMEAGPLQTTDTGGFRLLVKLPMASQLTRGKEQR
jgi:two-component system sensor histidine kinase DesK